MYTYRHIYIYRERERERDPHTHNLSIYLSIHHIIFVKDWSPHPRSIAKSASRNSSAVVAARPSGQASCTSSRASAALPKKFVLITVAASVKPCALIATTCVCITVCVCTCMYVCVNV